MRHSGASASGTSTRGLYIALNLAILLIAMNTPAQAQLARTRHVRPAVANGEAKFLRRLPGTDTLRLDLVLPLRDPNGLDRFLEDVYDPSSPQYRHFLTVPEFTARFGPTQEDYDAVVGYAKAKGLRVVGGSRDGMDVQVEGSVTSVEAAFNISMGVYQHPTENRTFFAPDREPTAALRFSLWHVAGLDNFSIPHPAGLNKGHSTNPNATIGSGPSASFLGSDMRAAYYGSGPLTGSGQSLGLLEYYGTNLSDVNTYFTNASQTNHVPISLISTDGTSTSCNYSSGCDDTEQTLDITQAISMAPGAANLYVFVGSTDTAILSAMSTRTPLAAQLSSSWTWSPGDAAAADPYFKKFAAQGQNFFQASGDSGSYTSRSQYVYPADDAYVTSVGGTDLVTSSAGGAWSSETAWADSGGGYYSVDAIAIPSWQKLSGVITASNKGSTKYRNAPDVAANADFTYYVCADQSGCTANTYGGTSFAAPLWAGYMALLNQQVVANGSSPLGFINPTLYTLGLSSGYSAAFHDITSGNNGGFSAMAGYDLVTGWGSMNGAGLINALAGPPVPNFTISASPASVSVIQGNNGTSTITTTAMNGFNAAITLSASGLPTGVTAGFGPNPIAAPGSGTSLLTLTVASNAAPGTYPVTVTGTSGTTVNSTTVNLTVLTPDFSISASPTTVTVVKGNAGTSTITTTSLNGLNSAITLSASGLPSGVTAGFGPNPIAAPGSGTSLLTLTVGASTATGTYSITVTGTGLGPGGNILHSTTVTLKVTAPPPPDFTIGASPSSVSVRRSNSTTTTVTTTGVNGFNASVSLSVSGLPSGVTASFNHNPIAAPGSGSSTLTFTASSRATTGTKTVTITGTGGGKTHTTTVRLTVNR